jgi:hypothetical protein
MRVTAKAFPSINEDDGVLVPSNFVVLSERRAGVRFVMAMLHKHPQIKWQVILLPPAARMLDAVLTVRDGCTLGTPATAPWRCSSARSATSRAGGAFSTS